MALVMNGEVPPSPDYIPGPEVPPSPDYIPGPEVPPSPDYIPGPEVPPSPDYIPGPVDFPLTGDDDDEGGGGGGGGAPSSGRLCPTCTPYDRQDIYPDTITTPNSPTHIEIPESCLPLRKRVRFASPTPSREVGESSAAGAARQDRPTIAREDLYGFVDMVDVPPRCSTSRELDYDITDTWDDLVGAIDEIAPTTVEGVNQRVTDLATIVEEETTSMYGIMEDAQDDRSQLRGRVNMLYRDRPVHRRLAVMIEREAKMAHEAWGLSMDASDYARSDVMSLRTTVVAQSALISELQSADHRRQRMVELQRQHGPTEGSSQPDAPEEASSSS
ncbi:hypothetical protein Tco_0719667 [Tanacetum coccineum]